MDIRLNRTELVEIHRELGSISSELSTISRDLARVRDDLRVVMAWRHRIIGIVAAVSTVSAVAISLIVRAL